jgi:hypothetical protein
VINQSRYIDASVRLDEPIAAQFAQYAAFIRASVDDVVDKALNCVSRRTATFRAFSRRRRPSRLFPLCVSVMARAKMRVSIRDGGLHPVCGHQFRAGSGGMDPPFDFVVAQERCFAPDECGHSTNLASQLLTNILCALYEIFTRLGVE